MSDPWLIVGADGLLGGTLRDDWRRHDLPVVGTSLLPQPDNPDIISLDLSQPATAWPVLPACSVAVIAAAITSLDQCRRQPTATRWVNVTQTVQLARRLADRGAFIIFISSNLVFDGSVPHRRRNDPVCPVTEYGRQKAEAEADLLSLGLPCAVIRLTKVFHPGLGLIKSWRDQLGAGQVIRPFSDYLCAPITLGLVVEAFRLVAQSREAGIWQVSSFEDVSYADIALQLAQIGGFNPALVQPMKAPKDTLEHLPRFTTLDSHPLEETFHLQIPSARQTLEAILKG